MLSPEDLTQLDGRYDSRYVLKDVCNDRHTQEAQQITELTVQQAKINTQLGALIKINSAMLTAVGAAIVGAIMRLIIK